MRVTVATVRGTALAVTLSCSFIIYIQMFQ